MQGGKGVLVGEGQAKGIYLKVDYILRNSDWFVWSLGKWNPHKGDPAHDRVCVKNPTWQWELQGNKMKVGLNGVKTYNFTHAARRGIGFTSDILKDATAHKGQLYVMTEAFFEAGITLNQLETITGARDKPDVNLNYLGNLRNHSGDRLINQSGANSFYEWDVVRKQFDPLKKDPYADITLAEFRNIRFRHTPGTLHKELKLEDLDGEKKWVEFGFNSKGGFPFDEINSIATYDSRLYMGTGTGVQIYSKLPLDLNGMGTHLMTLGEKKGGGPEPAEWVGQPADSNLHDSLIAVFTNDQLGVVETDKGQKWANVPNPVAATKARARAISGMMIWSQTRSGQVQGAYRDDAGKFDLAKPAYRAAFDSGRLLHDHIGDFIDFDRDSFTVWQTRGGSKMVTHHERDLRGGIINNVVRNFHFENLGPDPLLRLEEPFVLFNKTKVDEGVYLKVGDSYKWFGNNKFNDINDPDILKWLVYRHRHIPVLSENRFRIDLDLKNEAKPKSFEYRKVNGDVWEQIDWFGQSNKSTTIDRWDDCLFVGQSFWAASKAGLVKYQFDLSKDKNESLEFNYETPLIITHKAEGEEVTDFKQGRDLKDTTIRFEGKSDKVYQVDLTSGQDMNVFKKQSVDEFAEKPFVSTSYWEWTLENRVGNPPQGELVGIHKTAEFAKLEIDGGRFQMDKIHSVAVDPFKTSQLEAATEGGWFRFKNSKFHVEDLLRPTDVVGDISSIRHIGVIKKRGKNGKKRLLVVDAEGKKKSMTEKGEADDETDIGEYQGGDGFWDYQTLGEPGKNREIKIWTNLARGNPSRTLKKGRFGDDFVLGLPAMEANKSGEINYYMPTRVGIFKLDPKLKRLGLDGIDGEDEKPNAITMMLKKSPGKSTALTYVRDGRVRFSHAQGPLGSLDLKFGKSDTAQAIEEGPYELTTVGRKTPSGIRWSYFNKETGKNASPYIGIGKIPEYKERKGAWRELEAKIYYEFRGHDIDFWTQSSPAKTKKTQETVAIPKSLGKLSKLIEYKSINDGSIETDVAKFYLVGQGGMYEIDIERLIEELTPSTSSRPVTTPEPTTPEPTTPEPTTPEPTTPEPTTPEPTTPEPTTPEPTTPEPTNPPVVVKKPGTTLWEFKTGDWVTSSPAIGSDGTVYVGSYDKKLYAINGKSGVKLWEFETGGGVYSSPAIGPDGTVYVGSYDKKLYAINGKSGVKLWEFKTGSNVYSSPAIGPDGTVYVGSHDNKLYAINGKSGVKLWEFKTGGYVHSSPAIGPDGTVYVGSYDKKLYAINGKSGVKLWEFKTGDWVTSSPAIGSDGTVYVGSYDKKLYAINGKSGVKLWEFETGRGVLSSPAIGSDGTVYVGSRDNKLYALSGKSGVKLWEFETGGDVYSSPAIGSDGTVYVGSEDGMLYAINGKSGVKLWEFKKGGGSSSPAIGSDGTIYVGSSDKKLYAIASSSKGLADSPWPMRGQNARHAEWGQKK